MLFIPSLDVFKTWWPKLYVLLSFSHILTLGPLHLVSIEVLD